MQYITHTDAHYNAASVRTHPRYNKPQLTSANDQLDAQFLYFIIRLLRSSTCFEQRRANHQEVKLY